MAEVRNEARNEVRKEYIERGALEKEIDKAQELLKNQHPRLWYVNKKYFQGLAWARRLLLDAPATDVVEVRRGEWIRDEQSYFYHRYNCSACGYRHLGEPTKFCGECGADMRGNNNG